MKEYAVDRFTRTGDMQEYLDDMAKAGWEVHSISSAKTVLDSDGSDVIITVLMVRDDGSNKSLISSALLRLDQIERGIQHLVERQTALESSLAGDDTDVVYPVSALLYDPFSREARRMQVVADAIIEDAMRGAGS